MTLPRLFALGTLLWAAWLGYGLWRWPVGRDRLVLTSVFVAVPTALLMNYTTVESVAWAHLTFPFSLLLWPVLWLVCLGLAAARRRQRPVLWPLLGSVVVGPVMALLAAAPSI